jgi:hypothetical protein
LLIETRLEFEPVSVIPRLPLLTLGERPAANDLRFAEVEFERVYLVVWFCFPRGVPLLSEELKNPRSGLFLFRL